jgi:hypothetical protein
MQSLNRDTLDHSTDEARAMGTAKVIVALEGHPALEVSNRLLGRPSIERINLTSDPQEELSEEVFMEIIAGRLREDTGNETSLPYLPILGREKAIVKGWSHIIAGYPKAGKTELITRTIAEWRDEQVLYITEEAQSVWRIRICKLPERYQLNHVTLCFALGASPDAILKRIRRGSESVVVIDTIRTFLGFEDETDNSEVNRVLMPFTKAARDAGKTILFIHHMRKAAGQYGQGITGAHAFLGTVDIGIILKNGKNNRRQISGHGRVEEIEEFLYEKLGDGTFKALGAAKDVSFEVVKKRVMEVLDDQWRSTKDVRSDLDPKPSSDQVLKALEALANEDSVERNPPISKGKVQGATYKWRRVVNEDQGTSNSRKAKPQRTAEGKQARVKTKHSGKESNA